MFEGPDIHAEILAYRVGNLGSAGMHTDERGYFGYFGNTYKTNKTTGLLFLGLLYLSGPTLNTLSPQRLLEIRDDVLGRFDPHRNAHQIVANAHPLAVLR